jgi:hypothetical protein
MINRDVNASAAPRKYESTTPSGYFGNSPAMISETKNFISKEELLILNNFIRNNKVWDITETHYNENGTIIYDHSVWVDRVLSYPTLKQVDLKIVEIIQNMINRQKDQIEKFYNVKVVPTGPCLVRWPVGTRQEPHADKELHEGPDAGTPNDFPNYDLSSLFYLNDDYEGGELYFPLQNVQFKPKKGAAYFFPGDKNYVHGVTEIKSGLRFTCPFFWEIVKHTGDRQP